MGAKFKKIGQYLITEIAPGVVVVRPITVGGLAGEPVASVSSMAKGIAVARRYMQEGRNATGE